MSDDVRWTVACAIGAALLALALSWDFFAQSLDPWPDQAWILLAAERHHEGKGLTTLIDATSDDLAVTDYRRLVYFPPGYPLLVSALRSTGLPVATIVKTINAAALVIGLAGWMLLAGTVLRSRVWRLLFALLLVLACRGTIPKGGTTDYVFWALLPWWFLALSRKRLRWLVAAGAIVAVMIGFRWAAVILIPAGAVIAFFECGLAFAAAYAAIPTITFGVISLVNRVISGHASSILSYVRPALHWDLLASYYPFEAAFARPLAIEPLLTRVCRAIDPAMTRTIWEVLFRLLIPLALIVLLVIARRRGTPIEFLRRVAITYLFLVAMLAYMTVRYNWSGVHWTYLEEPRYYLPFFPAFALFWLVIAERVPTRAAMVVAAVAIVYLGQAEVRWTATRLRAGETDAPLLARLGAIAHDGTTRSVVFDVDVSRYLLWDSDRFSPRLYSDEATTARLHTTRPVDVWIVERPDQKTAYAADPQFDRKRLDALLRRFHPAPAWTSPDGRFRLYHALLTPPASSR